MAKVRFPDLGIELTDRQFERMERLCYEMWTGRISGIEFERRARRISGKITRALAYSICSAIREGRYERVVEKIEWMDVLVSISVRYDKSSKPYQNRYFEGRIIAPVPKSEEEKGMLLGAPEAIEMSCSEIDTIGDLFIKCMYMYFESKGYSVPMLDDSKWRMGIQILKEYMDREDKEIVFDCSIYDEGSASRPMRILRWHDIVSMPVKYWEDLEGACIHFGSEVMRLGMGRVQKEIRW